MRRGKGRRPQGGKNRVQKKKKADRAGPARYLKGLLGQPAKDFYRQAALHIQSGGLVEVEGCKDILLYDEQRVVLDMGGWQVSFYGDEVTLCGVGGRLVSLKGRLVRMEFSYKE